MIPKFRAWYTPFKGKKFGQEMKYGQAGRLITHAEMSPDKYILMQSTGLKDKNGVEIFEGDIVTLPKYGGGKTKSVVYFKDGKFAVDGSNYAFKDIRSQRMEVVGNFYDNP